MIIGTAGHIDHGKTALVKALTGVDADRLKEEKARGITIDLGFAYLPLASGAVLGFVDAPGHERFIHNMLAGAPGIDFVLLVVVADDGPMPQTREHLQILDLLGLARGIVALTKVDKVDAATRAAAEAEVRALLVGTGLADAAIMPVSTLTGEGVSVLRAALEQAAGARTPRAPAGHFRLAIDRCFTLPGAGTVVTGAAFAGAARVGDTVVLSPGGVEARIRSIHAQNRPVEECHAGQRCALNIAGPELKKDKVARGDWLTTPALVAPTARLDVSLRLLNSETRALHDGAATLWESLAICEHLAERFPQARLWPDDLAARAHCRSSATEMHGGFADIHQQMPMVVDRDVDLAPSEGTAANINRIQAIWQAAREVYGKKAGEPFLYGAPTIADCMYAPVVFRFTGYRVPLDATAEGYVDTMLAWPLMQEWIAAARAETEVIDF
jgi:selenocysteine-specific elongation factor SelB